MTRYLRFTNQSNGTFWLGEELPNGQVATVISWSNGYFGDDAHRATQGTIEQILSKMSGSDHITEVIDENHPKWDEICVLVMKRAMLAS